MYKKEPRLIGKKENVSNYVEGVDVYNSTFLHLLCDPTLTKTPYQITTYEYRPDLIAKDFYGSDSYMGILLAQTGLELSSYVRGQFIYLLPKETVDLIIRSI